MLQPNRVYRHHSGKRYTLLGISNEKATKAGWNKEAVYIDENGGIWTRDAEEFKEKFELTNDKPFFYISARN